jgi:hypothetical protein
MSNGFDLGGGGGSSFSFGPQGTQPGSHVSGTVIDMKEVQETNYDTKEPEFWSNGDPKMQYRVTLQTELRDPANPQDDGQRSIYLNGYRKPHPKNGTSGTLYAVLQSVQQATGTTSLQPGGKLTLKWVSGMGFTGDPRHYQAWYEAPAIDLGGAQPNPAAQAAPPVQQAPAFGSPAAAQPAWSQPATAAPVAQAAPPVQQVAAPVAQSAPVAAPVASEPSAAAIAALRAAGVNPKTVYPGYMAGDFDQ